VIGGYDGFTLRPGSVPPPAPRRRRWPAPQKDAGRVEIAQARAGRAGARRVSFVLATDGVNPLAGRRSAGSWRRRRAKPRVRIVADESSPVPRADAVQARPGPLAQGQHQKFSRSYISDFALP